MLTISTMKLVCFGILIDVIIYYVAQRNKTSMRFLQDVCVFLQDVYVFSYKTPMCFLLCQSIKG